MWKIFRRNAEAISAAVAVTAFVFSGMALAYTAIGNDAMPLEGKAQAKAAEKTLKEAIAKAAEDIKQFVTADSTERRIEATCALLTTATKTNTDSTILEALQTQLAMYEQAHYRATNQYYMEGCR